MLPRQARRALRWTALLVLLALLVPPLVRVNRFKAEITASIGAAIGRPVQVGAVELRLLPWPGFNLHDFTVEDDPSFSLEPILRASEVAARLRLSSLWRGRLEMARLSLAAPSVNVVRSPQGKWNFETLVVRASEIPSAPTARKTPGDRPRFPYIEASDGRIYFKLNQEKKAFALHHADFALWLASENEWGIRLQANPVRTDAHVNDAGTLKVSGTFQRARRLGDVPLKLDLRLEKAQLGQFSTLIWGRDRGWRGAVTVLARVVGTPANFKVTSTAVLDDFRRYDIPAGQALRAIVACHGGYSAGLQEFDCRAPVAEGEFHARGSVTRLSLRPEYDLTLTARHVPMSSLVRVARRSKQGLAEDMAASGEINAEISLRNQESLGAVWEGGGTASGVRLRSNQLQRELNLGDVPFEFTTAPPLPASRSIRQSPAGRQMLIGPFRMNLGGLSSAHVGATLFGNGYRIGVKGGAGIQRLLSVARLLGWRPPDSTASGTAQLDLTIAGAWKQFAPAQTTGSVLLHDVSASLRGLPLRISQARVLLSDSEVKMDKLIAQVPGTRLVLDGALSRSRYCVSTCATSFDVRVADADLSDLRAAATLISAAHSAPANGRLRIDRFRIGPLVARDVIGDLRLSGRLARVSQLRARIFGGVHHGEWLADFSGAQPFYAGSGALEKMSVSPLGGGTRRGWASGSADVRYQLSLWGRDASELASSATGKARFQWRHGTLRQWASDPGRKRRSLAFDRFSGTLRLENGTIAFEHSKMETSSATYLVTGDATLARELDLKLARVPASVKSGKGPSSRGAQGYRVTGKLDAPQVAPFDADAPPVLEP